MEKGNPKANRSMSALVPTSSGLSMEWRGIGLSNMIQSEIAPCLPLPFLPVFFGALDEDLRLLDDRVSSTSARDFSLSRSEILAQSAKIADMLRETNVSYLNLRDDRRPIASSHKQYFDLYDRVLECNPEAFEFLTASQPIRAQLPRSTTYEGKPIEQHQPVLAPARRDESQQHINNSLTDIASSSKSKIKKKVRDNTSRIIQPYPTELHSGDAVLNSFCKTLEEFCARAEIVSDEQDVSEWSTLSLDDVRLLLNKILSVHSKRILNFVPVDILERTLRILDHQIHQAEGLSMVEYENCDSSIIFCALESIHAALSLMSHVNMPKQVYKEEVIERILEFSKRQLTDVMSASDPLYGAFHKPSENKNFEGHGDNELEAQNGSARKSKRDLKGLREGKSTLNKVSAAVNTILHKLCTVLALLKDLLLIEKVSDSCILQLIKTSFTMLLVDNIQLLQLKAIGLVSRIFHSYTHHRTYIIDELVHILWKLRFSKRAMRAYHLPDEEQVQIQMITALLIQLVHCSTKLPEALRQASCGNSLQDISLDAGYPMRCYEAAVETCCLFWTRVLQRFTTVKAPDSSELKVVLENLVSDVLATLNLPEYPSSSPILEVLCVLLLQNAGLKSKDISVRSLSIDLLGSIAARLKHDAVMCNKNKFWVLHLLEDGDNVDPKFQKDLCCVCLDRKDEKTLLLCRGCHKFFHADCMGEQDAPHCNWQCQICICKKQILALQSYSRMLCKNEGGSSLSADPVAQAEIVQQMILNYLQNGVSGDDIHVFVCWFYICTWYKNYPESEEKLIYILLKVKSNLVVRDSGTADSMLTRDSVKKLTLALGQNSSFSRGFDKIFHMLLASLRENSPVIRAKALRSVSVIVEADPEVLCDKHVQSAVEGRFCDSSISVREAALELVGRHIALYPDVGLKYFEKVAERIKDTGLSVRKRAIKIVRDLCISNAKFSEHTTAFSEIMSRVSDDESSIQDLVCKTFYEFWFEEPALQTKIYGDGSSVPLELAKKTEQIVELLRRMPSHQFLVSVIKRNLALDFFSRSVKAAGISPVSLAAVRKRCELMCKCLLDRILQVEEMNNEEGEAPALPYVLVLHAFCVVDPLLCAPDSDPSQFVVTLEPYLKTQVDDRSVAQLLESIIFIIDSVLPLIRMFPHNVVDELEQDLKHMIVRHPFLTVVHACIKCLCSLSKIAGKGGSVVEHLLLVFFKRLDAQGIDNKQLLGRSLFCIGLLVRYGNSLLSSSGTKKIDVGSSVRLLFRKYLSIDDFSIKVRSLQALGFLLIARPSYMLGKEMRKIIEAALSAGSDVCLKLQALHNMYEYLVDSESQLGKEKISSNVIYGDHLEGGHGVPAAAGAGDGNVCGGIIQLYWNTILERCLDENEQVRQTSLKIMEIVLRQGLVHPITCVPYLIALEMDPLELNSKLAHHLLANMNDKYPAFIESRLGDGLQLSYLFIQSVREVSHENSKQKIQHRATGILERITRVGSLPHAKLGVSQIYRLIRGSRVSRNRFMFSVVRKFENLRWSTSLPAFLLYCAEVLVLLPFTTLDEPLYLVYAINRVVQVRVGVVEANMKGHVLQLQQRNGHTIENHNKEIQPGPPFDLNRTEREEEEPADHLPGATGKDDTSSDESCCISGEEEQTIWADWIAMTALLLLLKLKRHLKIVYSLNDARCMAFTPNNPQKPGESFSRQNTPFEASETLTSMPTTLQDLARRFHEFKNAVKEDCTDYAAYTVSIKRKRSTPTKIKCDQTADRHGDGECTVLIDNCRKRLRP